MVENSESVSALLPREIIGLIVANDKYESTTTHYDDVTFAEQEIERIENVFRKFTDEVKVMRNPNDEELEEYFEGAVAKARKLKKFEN